MLIVENCDFWFEGGCGADCDGHCGWKNLGRLAGGVILFSVQKV